MDPQDSDRRAGERYQARFPGYVQLSDGVRRITIIRDLSSSGVMLLMDAAKVLVGDKVLLELHIGSDPDQCCSASGHVVRVETTRYSEVWKRSVAVSFDAPLAMTEEDIARFNDLPPALEMGPDSVPSR